MLLLLYIVSDVHQRAHLYIATNTAEENHKREATVTLMLAWLSCLFRGKYYQLLPHCTLLTSPEQITSNLWGHVANPSLNGSNVRVRLPQSFKLAIQMDSKMSPSRHFEKLIIISSQSWQLKKSSSCCLKCEILWLVVTDIFVLVLAKQTPGQMVWPRLQSETQIIFRFRPQNYILRSECKNYILKAPVGCFFNQQCFTNVRIVLSLAIKRHQFCLMRCASSPKWPFCAGCSLRYLSLKGRLCNCLG